ncbi:diguanylate cyclase domain-containing protein [Acidihalobacter yilgarnensis]|nr:diguanylate cyclase [Acidihalobacter yilgarnensis]
MKNNAENQLVTGLRSSLENIVVLEEATIKHGFEKTMTIATRPFLIKQIEVLNAQPGNATAQIALQKGVNSFLLTGPSAITLYDKMGHEVAHAGRFVRSPEVMVPIRVPGHAQLLYRNGYFLRSMMKVELGGQAIGKAVVETPLPTLDQLFKSTGRRGTTAELVMCVPSGEVNMSCFPSTLTRKPLHLSRTSRTGIPLPMSYALQGKVGSIIAKDYRHKEVVAAYRPVGRTGLGVVLKIDSAELYAPIWKQLRYLLPLLAGLLLIALLSLRWLFTPLVAELVRSERDAHEANERLRDSESQVRTLVESVNEGIVAISENGIIELFNPGAERMFQYRGEEVLGRNVSLLMPEPFSSEHDGYLTRYWRTGEAHVIGHPREVTARRSNGEIFPVELRISQLDREGRRGFIGMLHDITERKTIEAQMTHFANYDALTNLANRRLVQDRVQQAIVHAQRAQARFAVMFIDLDKFKCVNDSHGHDVGDQLLQAVGRRLAACLRAEDTVGRQGGDEFIVLLAKLRTPADAVRVAEKILEGLSMPFAIMGHDLRIGASIGIAVYPGDGEDFETLIRHSDAAMYQAKKSEDLKYHFFDPIEGDTPPADEVVAPSE